MLTSNLRRSISDRGDTSLDLRPPLSLQTSLANIDSEAPAICETCGTNPVPRPSSWPAVVRLSAEDGASWIGGETDAAADGRQCCSEGCAAIAKRMHECLQQAMLSKGMEYRIVELESEDAQYAMNIMQRAFEKGSQTERDSIRRLMLKLALSTEKLPRSLFLRGVKCSETESHGAGSFADIFIGDFQGHKVALKKLRMFQMLHESQKKRMRAAFCYESLIWKNLRHEHVLSFLGVADTLFSRSLCMVLPWMKHGHVRHALDDLRPTLTSSELAAQIHKWIFQTASGLSYLHDEGVVHGDLRGANILIDETMSVQLADFGLAVFAEATSQNYASHRGGNARWLAPELIYPELLKVKSSRPTYASDVFAFGCVIVEMYTGKAPYSECSDAQVVARVPLGMRPKRSPPIDGFGITDFHWTIASSCWKQNPSRRPEIRVLVQVLLDMSTDSSATSALLALSRPETHGGHERVSDEQKERERKWNTPSNMRRRSETTLKTRLSHERIRVSMASPSSPIPPGPLTASISAGTPKKPGRSTPTSQRRAISALDIRRAENPVDDERYKRERNWNSPRPNWSNTTTPLSSPRPTLSRRTASSKRMSIGSVVNQIQELPETHTHG
ncbi:hypothetical protein EIP91_008397 [Steccherinum ochraceum]|uniref:Protein kinase domain-containing protein n=1 Tax=Steccherinum ochraceum TaxID=92696 RepID=A0A4R0R2X1_9APHY|nr:hypothetical protein EIP91_008397 [Steccherinum ochraceum]